MRHFLNDGDGDDRSSLVVAPVPWFPLVAPRVRALRLPGQGSPSEQRHGIPVLHPRYPLLPKIGMSVAPFLMASALRSTLRRIVREEYDFDLIDAHYLYPDGVAAVMLGRALGKPVTITARGSDVNLLGRHRWPRRLIRRAVSRADGTVTVSAALKTRLVGWGADEGRITVLSNGVDLSMFRPLDREQARRELGLSPPVLLYVGRLTGLKGIDLALRALRELPSGPSAARRRGRGGTTAETAGRKPGARRARDLRGPAAPGAAGRLLFGRRRVDPDVQPRGLAQRTAGIDGLRDAGRGDGRRGGSRDRSRPRGRGAGGGTLGRGPGPRSTATAGRLSRPGRHPAPRRALRLENDDPAA